MDDNKSVEIILNSLEFNNKLKLLCIKTDYEYRIINIEFVNMLDEEII